jgi:hypothetical protein
MRRSEKRLKENPHVESLAENRTIDDAELSREISSVSATDPLVARLLRIRNQVISHTDAEVIRQDLAGTARFWLPSEDIEELLRRAAAITHKYSLLYDASVCGGIFGAEDFKYTLQWLRRALSAHDTQIEKEIQQVMTTSKLSHSTGAP